jgi:LPS export ABC transporter protein LptC
VSRRSSGRGFTTDGRSAALRRAGWRLSLAALLILPVACGTRTEPPADPSLQSEKTPRQVIDGFILRATSAKGLLWVLQARRAVSPALGEPTRLDSMVVRFYDGESRPRSVLTSLHGEVDEKTNALIARDSVVVITPRGERLETESLRWDPKEERMTTDVFFRLVRGDDVLTGIGIDAEPGLERYVVHHQVRAEVRDQDDARIREEIDGPGSGKR